jgi:hypothetical protein
VISGREVLTVEVESTWYRRAYAGHADLNQRVTVTRVFEGEVESSGRIDWQVEINSSGRPMLAGSFLALHTQMTELP